eukprot:UN0260
MRLLHFASPSVLAADFFKFVTYSSTRWAGRPCLLVWKWSRFAITRCLCFMIGLDSFLVKVHAVSFYFTTSLSPGTLYQLFMFLVQVLGIVQLNMFVKDRLFMFIFAGEDGVLEMREKNVKVVWNAMLVREIWRKYSFLRFLAILLSFSDTDFQKLALNERSRQPAVDTVSRAADNETESDPSSAVQSESDDGLDAFITVSFA